MEELVAYIARSLVDQPDDVRVENEGPQQLRLYVAPDDLGRVIGRRGRTIKAIRALVRASFGAQLEVDEPESDADADAGPEAEDDLEPEPEAQ